MGLGWFCEGWDDSVRVGDGSVWVGHGSVWVWDGSVRVGMVL